MELIADGVLILAALAAMAYCMVLSRRLRRLTELDGGLGAAITALSREVDHLSGALAEAKTATTDSATDLGAQCRAAHIAARRLETLVKSANKTVLSKVGSAPTHEQGKTQPDQAKNAAANAESAPKLSGDTAEKTASEVPKPDAVTAPPPTNTAPGSEAAEITETTTKARSKTARKSKSSAPSKPNAEPTPDQTPELALGDTASGATVDGATLDQFIEAIITKTDADDNAALARRLVMALAAQQTPRTP